MWQILQDDSFYCCSHKVTLFLALFLVSIERPIYFDGLIVRIVMLNLAQTADVHFGKVVIDVFAYYNIEGTPG